MKKKGTEFRKYLQLLAGVYTGKKALLLAYLFMLMLIVCPEVFANEIRIILRMDDSGFGRNRPESNGEFLSDSEITKVVIKIVTKYNAKISIGVIPNAASGSPGYQLADPEYALLSSCSAEVDVLKRGVAMGHVEIALHGYSHEVRTINNGHASEFGGLPFEEQFALLSSGKKELEQSLEITIDTFIPPFNNHDNGTLRALQALGFKAISSGAHEDDTVEDLFLVPHTTSLRSFMRAPVEKLSFDESVLINALFHVYDFFEGGSEHAYLSLADFDAFLGELSSDPRVRYSTIMDEVRRPKANLRSEDSQLYALYRNRAGRLLNILGLSGTIGESFRECIPSTEVIYPIPHMRRLTKQMLWVEVMILSALFCTVGILFHELLKRTCRFPRTYGLLIAVAIGSGLCCVLLLLEGIFGIVGSRGFGSRLLLALFFAGAVCSVTTGHSTLRALNSHKGNWERKWPEADLALDAGPESGSS